MVFLPGPKQSVKCLNDFRLVPGAEYQVNTKWSQFLCPVARFGPKKAEDEIEEDKEEAEALKTSAPKRIPSGKLI